ncbi:MAG: GIY-YIG nuclease family protein [Candidatus Thorarchaeota archaeon]
MKGVYVLIINVLESIRLNIGALGELLFHHGMWVYVGSALGDGSTSIENRLNRHFSQSKKIHWHIDYLLKGGASVQNAIWAESDENMECQVLKSLETDSNFVIGPRGFGSSDCQSRCQSHILEYNAEEDVIRRILTVFENLGLNPRKFEQEIAG